jgi:hypothetical protein
MKIYIITKVVSRVMRYLYMDVESFLVAHVYNGCEFMY